jgi:hypothetical protein
LKITEVHAIILRQPEADPFHQAGAEVALHPLHRSREGGVEVGGLNLQAVLGIVAPPAVGDDGLTRLQVRQDADEGDESLIIDCRGRVTVPPLRGEASDYEAVLWVLKGDAFDHSRSSRRGGTSVVGRERGEVVGDMRESPRARAAVVSGCSQEPRVGR